MNEWMIAPSPTEPEFHTPDLGLFPNPDQSPLESTFWCENVPIVTVHHHSRWHQGWHLGDESAGEYGRKSKGLPVPSGFSLWRGAVLAWEEWGFGEESMEGTKEGRKETCLEQLLCIQPCANLVHECCPIKSSQKLWEVLCFPSDR